MSNTHNDSQNGSQEVTLDSLLLPGTPEHIRRKYMGLEQKAQTVDFGLLEEDIVVLDTETTGLSFRDCELIEIAAARMSGREIVDRFQTFVHPSTPIPPEIQRLTHITQLDVQDAPDAREAVAQLAEFVGGVPVLAHNATFDRTFVEAVPGGTEVSDNWIDTLALSRIALPRLSSHRLADMAHAFHCDSVTHRATDDVDALCGMWRIILCGLDMLPKGLLSLLADMHPDVSWAFRPIFSHLALEDEGAHFSLKTTRHDLIHASAQQKRADAGDDGMLLHAPTEQQMADAFAPGGVVSRMYDSYERRGEQVAMAQEVRSALATSTHRAIEAGTGVGKSVAYLLPEVLFAQMNNVTVGVATKTNALTDQLVSHELPALDAVLPNGVSFASLKGYEHYPCLHRLERAVQNDLPFSQVDGTGKSPNTIEADMLTAIAVVYAFASQSPDGDLDALGIRWRYVPRQMLTISSNDCLRNRCPFFPDECFVHGARRRAACSDVVVTNHSLLLRNVAADNAILPPVRHWVVDEAHGFEDEARKQWAVEVSSDAARSAFELLGGTKTGVIHTLMVRSVGVDGGTLITALLSKAAASLSRVSVTVADFFECVHELVHLAGRSNGYDGINLWIDQKVRESDEWDAVKRSGADCIEGLQQCVHFLKQAQDALQAPEPQLAGDLQEPIRNLDDLLGGIKLIVVEPQEDYVYSARLFRQQKRIGQEGLLAQKLDVGADLGSNWLSSMKSVVFTSATMAVGKNFNHFDHAVGLDTLPAGQYKNVQLSSSFDYDHNMSVIVAKDMPAPNDRRYVDSLTDLLFDVHKAMDGSVLTLFTNRREMEQVYASLAPRLSEVGLELVCQDRATSARRLRERFIAEKSLSLMALKSFWEGFDASGDTLRCVVIPKLPFSSPHDPLVQERELREDRAWWRYSLPDAVLSVKQAAGRLIRSSTDSGILVLADSRLVTKRYGRDFMRSLPSRNCTNLETANVGRFIGMWRSAHE